MFEGHLRLRDLQEAQVHLENLLHQRVVTEIRGQLGLKTQGGVQSNGRVCLVCLSVLAPTLNPMMKTLRVSRTVRQTSVDTLASSRHQLFTSASEWVYTGSTKPQLEICTCSVHHHH